MAEDITKQPYSEWLESALRELVELKPNDICITGILGNGDFYINMFRDSVQNELIFSSMIQQDAMIRNLEANGYIGEIEEDEYGEENED